MKKIAVEEHFSSRDFGDYYRQLVENNRYPVLVRRGPDIINRLADIGEGRLREMDEAGIDMQVLSLNSPAFQLADAAAGTAMTRQANNELSSVVQKYPKRFAGLASLAPQDPEGAAAELERTVKELGLKGAIINSHTEGEYLDDRKYWVILERAVKLNVPIYIHPRGPSPDLLKALQGYPELFGPMWGFAADTGLHAMRLICSGVFDEYPNLKIVLGHLGEALPFWQWRLDTRWMKGGLGKHLNKSPSQYIKDNFVVTTSGMFSQPALLSTYLELGADNILFAVDYPFESNKEAVEFIDAAPICDSDKEKICHLNAEKLFAL